MSNYWKKKPKYNAHKVVVDGITFDSAKEAKRYGELRLLEKCGEIVHLKLQPRFLLQDKFSVDGKTYRKVEYVADFSYTRASDGVTVVEDVKGYKTDVYKLKKKLFLFKYGNLVQFVEV